MLLNGTYHLNPYMYDDFREINPKLTRKMYDFLRRNKSEWKILCGLEVRMKYDKEFLEGNWLLNAINREIFEMRFVPEYYLDKKNWNNGK